MGGIGKTFATTASLLLLGCSAAILLEDSGDHRANPGEDHTFWCHVDEPRRRCTWITRHLCGTGITLSGEGAAGAFYCGGTDLGAEVEFDGRNCTAKISNVDRRYQGAFQCWFAPGLNSTMYLEIGN